MALKNAQLLIESPSGLVVGLRSQPNLQTPLDGLVFGDGHGGPHDGLPCPLDRAGVLRPGPLLLRTEKVRGKGQQQDRANAAMGCVVSVVPLMSAIRVAEDPRPIDLSYVRAEQPDTPCSTRLTLILCARSTGTRAVIL